MDEISELQKQLAVAQLSTTANRLSERNCIELVMKLQSLNLIELIFTRSGKEYLTLEQLTLEIEDEILSCEGRVNVTDLPDALNVSLTHIQNQIPKVIKSDNSVRLVRGELLTDYYLASIMEDINDALLASETGTDDIGAIATRYSLPVDLIRETIILHESTVNAIFDKSTGTLRSSASIAREKATARGLLRAITAPTLFHDIANARQLDIPLLREVADEMLLDGRLAGHIEGRATRATFMPAVFADAAIRTLTAAFTGNGFLGLERLRMLHISDTDSFVRDYLEEGIILQDCIVGPVLIGTTATSAGEAIMNGSWLDVQSALPPDFPEVDVDEVLKRITKFLTREEQEGLSSETNTEMGKKSRAKRRGKANTRSYKSTSSQCKTSVFGNRFIASTSLVSSFSDYVTSDAVDKAERRAKAMTDRMEMVLSSTDPSYKVDDTSSKEEGKKGKGKGKRRAGGRSKDVGKPANNNEKESEFPVVVPTRDDLIELILAKDSFAKVLEVDYLDSSVDGETMLGCILEALFGEDGLHDLYHSKASEAVVELEKRKLLAKQMAEKMLLANLEEVQLYSKAAESLPDEELVNVSKAWVINESCVNLLCQIVMMVAQNTGVTYAGLAQVVELPSKKEKMEILRAACSKLVPTLEAKVRPMLALLSDKDAEGNVENILTMYDENTIILDLPERRPLDKKGEKAAFSNARAKMALSLDAVETLSEMMSLKTAAVLTNAKACGGAIVSFSLEDTLRYCKAIEENAKPIAAGAALRDLRESMSENETDRLNIGVSASFAQALKGIREYVG